MTVHPRDVPVRKTFDVPDVAAAINAVNEIVDAGFANQDKGFRVLMPKEKRTAKRIGYAVTTGISSGLRKRGSHRDVKYWTYHHDGEHYAIVFTSSALAERLGL